MPRACIPNARFLAHADSVLLPLLAPRVFAQAPYSGDTIRRKSRAPKRECKEGNTKSQDNGRVIIDWRSHSLCANSTAASSCGDLSTSWPCQEPSPDGSRKTSLENTLDRRYADISHFARQQIRHFSTQRPPPEDVAVDHRTSAKAHRDARRLRRHRSSNTNIQNGFPTAVGGHKQRMRSALYSTTRPSRIRFKYGMHRKPKFHVRSVRKFELRSRIKWDPREVRRMRTERRLLLRLQEYLKNVTQDKLKNVTEDNLCVLQRDGRYRSLRRRYLNHKRRNTEHVSLKVDEGRLESRHGRLKAFAYLDQAAYPQQLKNKAYQLRLHHDRQCSSWISLIFKRGDTTEIAENWMNLDQDLREKIWPYLLVYLLEYQPDWALQFLRVLIRQPELYETRRDIIADALTHISSLYRRRLRRSDTNPRARDAIMASQLVPLCYYFMRYHCGSESRLFSQSFYYNIARLADIEDLKLVLALLEERPVFLLADTLLQFANTFAKAGEQDCALRCLKLVRPKTANPQRYLKIVDRKHFRWSCAVLLRMSSNKGQNYHGMPALVAQLVQMGVELDTLLYNAIMKNAMEAGDYSTAFQVFNTLGDRGLTPDEFTFSTLLHGCSTTNEPAQFHDFAEHCLKQVKELHYPRLATDYLYYHYTCSYRGADELQEHDFENLLRIYSQLFSTEPLELFFGPMVRQPPTNKEENDTTSAFAPLSPSPLALYIILQTRIQIDLRIDYSHVWQLYCRFEQIVRQRADPRINAMAAHAQIWNAFLLAFCRNKQFTHASRVMEDMRAHNRQPDHYSWTMMMQAFFRAGQTAAGERIFKHMSSDGTQLSQFTYGAMLIEYARNENYEEIGRIMDHTDSEQLDPAVLGALGKVRDRWRLLREMQESEKRKERDAASKDKTERRIALWRSLLEELNLETLKGNEFASMLPPAKQEADGKRSVPSSDATVTQ